MCVKIWLRKYHVGMQLIISLYLTLSYLILFRYFL